MAFKVANKVETFGNLTFSATRRDNKTHWNQMNQFCTNSPIKNPQPTSYNRNRGHISQIFPFLVICKNCLSGEKTQKVSFPTDIYIHIYIKSECEFRRNFLEFKTNIQDQWHMWMLGELMHFCETCIVSERILIFRIKMGKSSTKPP